MKDYVILTDAAADPADQIAKEYPFVKIIPMSVSIAGREYIWGGETGTLTCEEFYSLLRSGYFGSTSSISPGIYFSYFEEYLMQGKDIIYMSFSSGMSCTYTNACMAADELREDYPDSFITCIDTLNASTASGFLVREAAAKKNEGLNYWEMVEWINASRLKIGVCFSVDTLDHLVHGGRLSKPSAVIGSALHVKPFLTINREGKLEVTSRPVGIQKALNLILKKMEDEWNPDAGKYVLICHGDCEERADWLKNKVLEIYPEAEVETGTVGPVIGIHTGRPGNDLTLFLGKIGGHMFEKVNPSHPDKLADRIAGAIVDLAYTKTADPKVAAEVLIGHGHCHIINETSENFSCTEIASIVHRIAGENVSVSYAEYLQDGHLSDNQRGKIRCGDNGIFRGVPLTEEQLRLSRIAHCIYSQFQTDGKYLLDLAESRLVVCQSNAEENEIRDLLLSSGFNLEAEINPLGFWTGGIDVDSGATNRKLGSDMGDSLTGGGLWGKDLSKADITLNLYAWKYAQILNETVEIMCAIGDEEVIVAEGSGKKVKRRYEDIIEEIRAEIFLYYGGFEKFAEWGYF